MPIRVLDSTVAAQIAAGEVVERPASVVKELVENAIDAGARRVSVGVRGGGIEEILVQDDGAGIAADEIEVAFARHATSKLSSADDLWSIATLGFRGEALPSIAAVAQVICQSRTADGPTGTELRVAGGEVQHLAPRGGPVGTTFTIRNLFYNVPVRREFLKTPAAEAAAIANVVTQYALAYPQVAFTMVRDGKRVFQTSGRGQLADVILELYGVEIARQMIAVQARAGEDIGEVKIAGMVSAPSVTRGARDGMHITVNGRAIAARGQVGTIVEEAYHTLLMKGRFPIVVLRIDVHPAAVDVNVHPTKSEVKFRNPALVARTLGSAVRDAVQGAVVIQGWRDPAAGTGEDDEPASSATADVPPAQSAQEQAGASESGVSPDPAAPIAEELPHPTSSQLRPEVIDRSPIQASLLEEQARGVHAAPWAIDRPSEPRREEPSFVEPEMYRRPAAPSMTPPAQHTPADRPAASVRETAAAFEAHERANHSAEGDLPDAGSQPALVPAGRAPRVPALRALAQLAQTYLLTEGPDSALYLIDQHAAHERITYERLLAQHAAGALQSQALLLPQQLNLPPDAHQTLLDAEDELAAWGFAIDAAESSISVQSVPAGLRLEELGTTLADLASHLAGTGSNAVADRRDALLATLACHTSVRAGQALTLQEQQALLDQLAECDGPRTCPHGRPTLIVITRHQLERQFGRLGA